MTREDEGTKVQGCENASVILENLSIGYKTKQGIHAVAESLSATINRGCLTCLLGENGVGKSTLLRTLSGFQPKLSGNIFLSSEFRVQSSQFFDEQSGRADRRVRIEMFSDQQLARTIGIVLTEKPDVQQMTVMELVEMGRAPYTGFWGRLNDDDRLACDEAISLIGIDHLRNRLVQTLSDGERQKVMIAKALAQQTPIIYLDEPTAFLDYPSKVDMLLLLSRISREAKKTVFLSTHDLELALQVADTVWLMQKMPDGKPSGTSALMPGTGANASGTGALTIGSPRELADSGVLSQYIERSKDISFNKETLSVRVINS